MLDQDIKNQVVELFKNLKSEFVFKVTLSTNKAINDELIELLEEVTSCSDKLSSEVQSGDALSFEIVKKGQESSNIRFRAIPNGHEFSTFLLAILNMDGIGKNIPDEATLKRIAALKGNVVVSSYISLSCTNCPDVVQALNVMAIYNTGLVHEIVDGALFQEEIDNLKIQAVPSVYVNGKPLHIGRSSLGELLAKLEEALGSEPVELNLEPKHYDVIIVGGGPAGVSSAIYSARKGLKVALVADKIGGQVAETVDIENLISVTKTTGQELTANLKAHMNDYSIDVLENRRVEKTEVLEGIKRVHTSFGELLLAPALIIATGASWRKINVPGESNYIGSGVAFCTHCDGPFYKGKRVVVVGGGNSGLEAAIDLSSIASEVTLLEFSGELKGDKVLQDKLSTLSNVKTLTNAQTLAIEGDGTKVNGLQYKDRLSGAVHDLAVDGVFVQIGLTANSKVFQTLVDTNQIGEIEIDAHCRTKAPGVYAAGDVSVVPYKQIVISMGEGSKAALSAFEDSIKGRLLSA